MNPFRFLLLVLVVWRMARIVSKDTVSQQARSVLGRMAAGKEQYSPAWYLAELINCQFCTGVWISAFLSLILHKRKDGIKNYLVNFLAIAGGQNLLALLIERGNNDY